jgi:two-component system chemotaxis response regulator CheB
MSAAIPIRALVIEDSLTMRRKIVETLAADPGIEVVGDAGDGRRGVELCSRLRPDVVTLDMLLPLMDGQQATEYIMAHFPTPILVVSASTNRADLFKTYDALAAGAVDVLEKPRGDEPEGVWEAKLLSTIKMVARIRVITHPKGRHLRLGSAPPRSPLPAPPRSPLPAPRLDGRVLALGASTGGPSALVQVLRDVPEGLPSPVFAVLHIDEPFGAAFADWLGQQTHHRVAYARDATPLGAFAGQVVLAPPGKHAIVREGRVLLTMDAPRHSCRPSIDVLFESLAVEYRDAVVACLLTGMGRDGAQGLLAIRRAGGTTIAQDENTSVVYGMPREAALLGAASAILPLSEIGKAAADAMAGRGRGAP